VEIPNSLDTESMRKAPAQNSGKSEQAGANQHKRRWLWGLHDVWGGRTNTAHASVPKTVTGPSRECHTPGQLYLPIFNQNAYCRPVRLRGV